MGQQSSSSFFRPKLPLAWILGGEQLREHRHRRSFIENTGFTYERDNYLEENVKRLPRECNIKKKNVEKKVKPSENSLRETNGQQRKVNDKEDTFGGNHAEKYFKGIIAENPIEKSLSEPSLFSENSCSMRRRLGSIEFDKHKRRRTRRSHKNPTASTSHLFRVNNKFRHSNLDALLLEASIERPANIPVVLSFPSILYQTQSGTQDEIALPLGTLVNAVFKNQSWLYVQTAHGQEGYVGYAACVPLGILPQSKRRGPCWEDPTDVFPQPLGNIMDSEKDTKSEYGTHEGIGIKQQALNDLSHTCNCKKEQNDERSYVKISADKSPSRHTFLISSCEQTTLNDSKKDIVTLIADGVINNDWLWISARDNRQVLIPTSSVIATNGALLL